MESTSQFEATLPCTMLTWVILAQCLVAQCCSMLAADNQTKVDREQLKTLHLNLEDFPNTQGLKAQQCPVR